MKNLGASAPVIGLLSPCGWGNLGDGAIQDANLRVVRASHPNARFVGLTLNPSDTERRHGIAAYPVAGFSRPHYTVANQSGAQSTAAAITRRLTRLPVIGGGCGFLSRLVFMAAFELRNTLRSLRIVRDLDLLVVAGGGQLDDYWGGAWGHPYVLFKWATLAKVAGTPLVFLSVGAGTIRSPLARWFFLRSLRSARYRSYRDGKTLDVVRQLGLEAQDAVAPDLAFGALRPAAITSTEAPSAGLRVGVSPIAFLQPRSWPVKDHQAYSLYVREQVLFIAALLDQGHHVSLYATDSPDERAIDDIVAGLRAERGQDLGERLERVRPQSTDDLLDLYDKVDVVVASRLHGVLVAHVARKAVLAVSYDWKVDRHMTDLGQSEYCLGIGTSDHRAILAAFTRLVDGRREVENGVATHVQSRARAVSDQWKSALALTVPRDIAIAIPAARSAHAGGVER